jgi:hypothetical protein
MVMVFGCTGFLSSLICENADVTAAAVKNIAKMNFFIRFGLYFWIFFEKQQSGRNSRKGETSPKTKLCFSFSIGSIG